MQVEILQIGLICSVVKRMNLFPSFMVYPGQ